MIKVNLNKTKTHVSYQTQHDLTSEKSVLTSLKTYLASIKKTDVDTIVFVKIIMNFILIFCFPLGLKVYEIRQISQLNAEKSQEDKILNKSKGQLSQLEQEIQTYSYLKDKALEFSEKKDFLKQLGEARLVIPRTIDLIQNKIPEAVWLESLNLNASSTEGKSTLSITGESLNEAYVNAFANSLHDILDENSITVNTQDVSESNSVVKVRFDLKGIM